MVHVDRPTRRPAFVETDETKEDPVEPSFIHPLGGPPGQGNLLQERIKANARLAGEKDPLFLPIALILACAEFNLRRI